MTEQANKVERFEDLIAWQKARELTKAIYKVTQQQAFSKDLGLLRQMREAAVSVMANIAEGFERGGRGEFHQFLSMAKGSCAEVRSHLYVALDVGYVDDSAFERLQAQAKEVGRIVGGLRVAVQRQRLLGKRARGSAQSSALLP
ncbi:MAG: four helix bundle protein [Deltaproteobacteria bacterium]|nr:four helix bundle protein [Deltaproteobacteria bacterium]